MWKGTSACRLLAGFIFSVALAGWMAATPATYAADSSPASSSGNWTRDDAAHLLRRAGFGGTPAQIDRLYDLGRAKAVDYLITGKLPAGATAPFDHVDLQPFSMGDEGLDMRQGPERQFEVMKLRSWWMDRMVRTDRPLEEKMTLFWHGLFTSGLRECKVPRWLAQQNALFHKEAMGNYERLTWEILHDPAMLKYLNNDENIVGRPNENLGRELMELFTMGEGNGYTEKDIPEVARALTGLTPLRRMTQGGAVMIPRRHDFGRKTIFGQTGNFGPDDVVRLIFARPYPAEHLAQRLWTFFGHENPTADEIAPVAEALRHNHWELAPALRALFNSPSFYSAKTKFAMIKSPIDLEVGTLRLLEEPDEPRMLLAASNGARQIGEELFQPPNVKGWPGGEHWITSAGIYVRYNIATAMANGTLGAGGIARGELRPNAKAAATTTIKARAFDAKTSDAQASHPTADAEKSGQDENAGENPRKAANKQAKKQQFQAQRQKIIEELRAMPPLPSPSDLVQPAKLFPSLGKEVTAAQVVDAAIARFLQQPLPDEKKAVLVQGLGEQPIKLGEPACDRRVRQMIGLLMSTPEYQME